MPHRVTRSYELYQQAQELIPGGTQLVSRRPTRYAPGISPVYAVSARGARFIDVDGNEYIDWASGIGAIILGYCDAVVDDAVSGQLRQGTMYSINHELEVELAEELVRRVPCAEMVRYAKCGGEACAMAVRIARGVTGRDKILFCGYHGWHDWYLAANLETATELNVHLFPGIEPTGVPRALQGTAIPFGYGDLDGLCQLLEKHRGQIAAVMMEPLRSELPPPGYLQQVAAACRDAGVILIFDEVSTGFRLSHGGAQQFVEVTPDMAVFAKSISNGYPMAAVVGRRDVMEPAARMFISSTYWSDTLGLRAALTTLRELERRDVPRNLFQFGRELKQRINDAASDAQLPARCGGLDVHPQLRFEVEDAVVQQQLTSLYIQEMARRGCHGYAAFYLNAAQGADELRQTEQAAREVFSLMRQAIDQGTLDSALQCAATQDVFRRLVR